MAMSESSVPDEAIDISGDGGCCKRILSEGDADGGSPEGGSVVQVHYVGTLMDGSKFDSSRDRPGNFSFKLGKGQVIKGWDTGVATMKKGEIAELYCRSDYAYGERGHPPTIPGGATLKFEVELLSWGEPKKERWELSAAEKMAECEKYKAQGTEAFKRGDYTEAMPLYAEAATWVEHEYDFTSDEEKTNAKALQVSCLLNEAQCALKSGEWQAAVSRCTSVLEKDAQNVKALFRRGSAYIKLGEFELARSDLKEAASLDPASKEIRATYASIKEAQAAAKQADKALFAKMMSK